MKNLKQIFIFLLSILLFIPGCTSNNISSSSNNNNNQNNFINGDTMESLTGSNNNCTEVVDDYKQILSNEIKIYQISRDVFQLFLQNPTYNTLKNNKLSEFSYPQNGEWYITYSVKRFPIRKQLIDFAGNQTQINEYLSKNNVAGKIENMAIIDSPNMPLTIWVKTTKENVYITISVTPNDTTYIYQFYTQLDFNKKYMCKNGKLIVRGKEIVTKDVCKIYYNYADIPLIVVLKALGANVNQQNKINISIHFNNKDYQLNMSELVLYHLENENCNLLYKVDGGSVFIYSTGNELMVDSATLNSILSDMGEKITIEIDIQNEVVNIT